MKKSAPEPKT